MNTHHTHIIFGAGLIGGFLGGILTSLDITTKLVCRPSTKKKLNNGLKLTDYLGNATTVDTIDFIEPQDAVDKNQKAIQCDFLWITVKCTGIEQASKDITPFVGPDTILLCCQNGLGSDTIIRKKFPKNPVLRVMVPFNVAEPNPGHLHRGSEGKLTIEIDGKHNLAIETLAANMNTPLMPVDTTKEMRALLWAKLQLNLGNSVNALANIPVKKMLEQRYYRLVIAALMKELLLVTNSLHITLPKLTALPAKYIPFVLSLPNFLFNLVANKMLAIDPTVRTSMWWDLSQGKKTEIDYLNGSIVNSGKTIGTASPVNTTIINLIKQIEKDNELNIPRKGISSQELYKKVKASKA